MTRGRESTKKKDTDVGKGCALSAEKKSGNFTRKIEPLRGGLVREMIRCGRANCKCAGGSLHGPYHYRVWMVKGRRYKTYIKQADLERTKAGIEAFRAQKREQQQSAAQLIAMWREIRQERHSVYDILRSRGFNI